jgi:hypothetical protein
MMLRPLLVLALVAGASLAGLAGPRPTPASACSIVPPSARTIGLAVETSPVIAVGRIAESSRRQATFVVEESIKGSARGDSFVVDNRGTYTAVACSPYDEPFREGYRFATDTRYVLFLEQQVDGLWQVGYLGLAAFPAPADDLERLGTDWYASPGQTFDLTLGDIRALAVQRDIPPARPTGVAVAVPSIEKPRTDSPVQSPDSDGLLTGGNRRMIAAASAIAVVVVVVVATGPWWTGRIRRGR